MKTIITDNTTVTTNASTIDKVFDAFAAIDTKIEATVRREMMAMEAENVLLQFVADLVKNDPEFKAKYTAFRAARLMGLK